MLSENIESNIMKYKMFEFNKNRTFKGVNNLYKR